MADVASFACSARNGRDHFITASSGMRCINCGLDLTAIMGVSSSQDRQEPSLPTRLDRKITGGGPKRSRKLVLIRDIYIRDGRKCRYCRRGLMPLDEVETFVAPPDGKLPSDYPTLDHLIPKSKGGMWVLDNLGVACAPCNNSRKGDQEHYDPPIRIRRRIDASRCELCHGRGTGWDDDRDKPCPHCRGAGAMDIDRYAELLHDQGKQFAVLRHRHAEAMEELTVLRSLLEEVANGGPVWRERAALTRMIQSQRRTIDKMAVRIEELGGGRARSGLHVVDEEDIS